MCQWFGFSSNTEKDAMFFFKALFSRRITRFNRDGWGAAFYKGNNLVVWKEKTGASKSRTAKSIASGKNKIVGKIAIGHIREASEPKIISYEMSHPFSRKLWGRQWVFCHKGDVSRIKLETGSFKPVSRNDSERLFCYLMNELNTNCSSKSGAGKIKTEIKRCARILEKGGEANFLLSDGNFLIANGHSYFRHAKIKKGKERTIIFSTTPLGMGLKWKKAHGIFVARNGSILK